MSCFVVSVVALYGCLLGTALFALPGTVLIYENAVDAYDEAHAPLAAAAMMTYDNVTAAPCRGVCVDMESPRAADRFPLCSVQPWAPTCRVSPQRVCEAGPRDATAAGSQACVAVFGSLTVVHPLRSPPSAECVVEDLTFLCSAALPHCWPQRVGDFVGGDTTFLPGCDAAAGEVCEATVYVTRATSEAGGSSGANRAGADGQAERCGPVFLRPPTVVPYRDSPGSLHWLNIMGVVVGIFLWSFLVAACVVATR